MPRSIKAPLLLALVVAAAACAPPPPRFELIALDHLFPRALNDQGQVAGHTVADDDTELAALWTDGVVVELGTLGGPNSSAADVNEEGHVAGRAETAAGVSHAFVWKGDVLEDLGALAGDDVESFALALNEQGRVVGSQQPDLDDATSERATRWHAGAVEELGTLGGKSAARDINNAAQIAGESEDEDGLLRAVLFEGDVLVDLGTIDGAPGVSRAFAINEEGHVVGHSTGASFQIAQAFVWRDGQMDHLGTLLGGDESNATGINDEGLIVGHSSDWLGARRAVLWRDAALLDLNDLVDAPGWHLSTAYDVNARGEIVGHGVHDGEEEQGYLLRPIE